MPRPFAFPTALAVLGLSLAACAMQSTRAEDKDPERDVSRKIADAGITAKIKTTYLFNRHLNSFRINVDTENGRVTLDGTVKSGIQKDLAGAIAENVDGVSDVKNDLQVTEGEVREPEETDRTFTQAVADATTTASVKMALAFEAGVKASEIDVDTSWGTVTLSGEVGTRAERELASKTAEDVSGVQKVVNEIEVRS